MAEYWFESHDGLRLFSRVYPPPTPDAPVVLCLHGLMRNGRDFDDLALHLAARHRVIVPDVRGRGRSARDPNFENYQIPVYVRDVLTLLCGLGAQRVRVIGTSMGGLMGLVLAATQRGLVSGIVLNDVGPEIDSRGLERIRGYVGKSPPVKDWSEATAQIRSIYENAWPGLGAKRWEKIARSSYRENAQGVPEIDADPNIAERLRDKKAVAPDLWPMWGALLELPMLVIRGASSDILSEATLERMRRTKADLGALVVANRGHAPLLDEPECLSAIEEFLARVPGGPAPVGGAPTPVGGGPAGARGGPT